MDLAIKALFDFVDAVLYRRQERIPAIDTRINVVAMVFGNLGADSGTGAHHRDPATGRRVR